MSCVRFARFFAALAVLLLPALTGCTLFTHYTSQMRPVTDAVAKGNLPEAAKRFPEKRLKSGNDQLCYLLERGTLDQLSGKHEESNRTFDQANALLEANDQRAKVAVGKILAGGGALLLNDKAMAYEGEPFERIAMHTLQAINYLMLGQKQEARVEIKRAYEQSKALAVLREKEIANSRTYAQQKNVKEEGLFSAAAGKIFTQSALNDLRRRNVDPYQNAFTSYLSAVVYEMNGGFNDAYIDCVAAHEIAPGARYPAQDLARLASLSGMADRVAQWEKMFGPAAKRPDNSGELVVFFQCGLAAHKDQVWFPIPVPIYDGKAKSYTIVSINVSFPRYVAAPYRAAGVEVRAAGQPPCTAEIMTDLDAIALQNFFNHLPALLIRLAIRAAVKATAEYALRNQLGQIGGVDVSSALASATFAFTEQADLRSWLLVPANLQCSRCALPAGEQEIEMVLKGKGGEALGRRTVKAKIEPGKFTIVNVRAIDDFVGEIQVSSPM